MPPPKEHARTRHDRTIPAGPREQAVFGGVAAAQRRVTAFAGDGASAGRRGIEAATPKPVPGPRIAMGRRELERRRPPASCPRARAAESRAPERRSRSAPRADRGRGRVAGTRSRTTRCGSSGRPNRPRPDQQWQVHTKRPRAIVIVQVGRDRLPDPCSLGPAKDLAAQRTPRPDQEPIRNGVWVPPMSPSKRG